jgi:hypothetical protein
MPAVRIPGDVRRNEDVAVRHALDQEDFRMPATAARLLAIAAAALFAVSAGPASARSAGITFSLFPAHVVQGNAARVAVTVRPSGVSCTLGVRYHDGSAQSGLAPATATGGHASWTWTVPTNIQAGVAKATVHCARAGAVTRSVLIVGRVVEPKIEVKQQGFSTRPLTGAGTRLSYGLILHNDAGQRDALNVSVQVNFVLADDHLLGTDTQTLDGIAAGSDYALGNTVYFPGAAPIVRLEVVIQVANFGPHTLHYPTLANIHIVPATYDTKWVGTIEGELQNTDPVMTLRATRMSCVLFDSAGIILGGGSGVALQALPPGAREFLQLTNGFDVIPAEQAASAMVSMMPTWQAPGT